MTISLNLDLPRLRKRAQAEADKVAQAADSAGQAVSGIHLPQVDVGGTLKNARRALGEARRTLSEGTDEVAVRADQVATKASDIGHGLRGAVDDLRGAVDDLRSLRVVRQQPPRRDPWPGLALIGGIGAGVAAMFLFDPRDGARRRALLRDKLGKWSRLAVREARGTAVDLRNRSQGLIHEARTAIASRVPTETETETETPIEWPTAEPVGAGVGAGTSTYGEMGYQPGVANGREEIG
jgi:hypothetical protein